MNAMQIQVGADAAGTMNRARPHVFDLVGGRRGAVDGGLPPLVFVVVNAVAGAQTTRSTALAYAIGAAVTTGLAIYVDAAYGLVFAASAAIGRPLVGTIYHLLYGGQDQWRADTRLRRAFAIATLGWAMVFATRAGVQAFLSGEDRPGLLAAGKLLLGWPLTIVALVLTLAYIRRVTTDRAAHED
jgi:hypothetical protein